MGTPEFALATLQGLLDFGLDLRAVYTQPDRPKGRGNQLTPPPVKELALKHGISVHQPLKLRDPAVVEELRAIAPDLIVVVAYGQILPKSVLEIPQYGCINVHASLLPRYRGAAPINKAIIDGETETGVTTMYMDVGLDTGDMLIKRVTPIGPLETAGEVHDRLALLGREAMEETLRRLCAGTLTAEKQEDALSNYAPMLKKEDGLIDWERTAAQIHNQVRGLDPWPGAYTQLRGEVLKIARTAPEAGSGAPGTVLAADAAGVRIACGEGVLRVGELQLPGKKRLAAGDFLRGCPLSPGTRLGSD
ncbi:methionyl-tRNA formyltransferase [Trichloromonas sp.]|uniref:methionyl-tRNA formyltransferase n=1 Tax=Trichloromonas sp. TaxID=3069249 RepID=UPI003D8171DE